MYRTFLWRIDVPTRTNASQRQAQPVCVEYRRVNVAAGHRISDAGQLIKAVWIAPPLLRAQIEQRLLVYLAEIRRSRHQREVQLVGWQRAVLDDDLIDD